MKRVNIICEGSTEEQFVRKLLQPYFINKGISISVSSLDGGFNYESLKFHIIEMLNSDKAACVTTMIDLYGLKGEYPEASASKTKAPMERVVAMEKALAEDINLSKALHNRNFIPYYQLHEFEALLFSDPAIMEEWLDLDRELPEGCFSEILAKFDSPEHINDSPETAPSKRIKKVAGYYQKINEGILIASDIGLDRMREKCMHFNNWIYALEAFGAKK